MKRWYMDFETHWDTEYSLRRMTPPEYIMDPRFEALGCAVTPPDSVPIWVDGPDLPTYFDGLPWDDMYVTSHNALFDMLILSLRYGKTPKMYGDTLAMARNWISHSTGRVDLATCAQYYGLEAKGTTVNKFKGMSLAAIKADPMLYDEMRSYAIHDAELCREIFEAMIREGFPPSELEVIDMVVRMASQPAFALDQSLLSEHLATIQAEKAQLLADAYIEQDNVGSIMSNDQLAAKLIVLGVDVPTKLSKTTGKTTWAFAKTDQEFTDLLEHEKPMVQALVAARLGHKSTLEETRTKRMIDISLCMPRMPVPLKYSGAHTHRFSGDWKINAQNLPNGSALRRALIAPKGHVVVSADASQIEARLNATLSGQKDLEEGFRNGVDVYSQFAEELYGYPVNKHDNKVERFVGKTSILSLGYSSSWMVFQNMCRVKGEVQLTNSEALTIVEHYRNRYPMIVSNWHYAQHQIIPGISNGIEIPWGPLQVERYAIRLPNGNKLRYPDMGRYVDDYGKPSWMYRRGPMHKYIYGAKVVENVIQALAFVFIMEIARQVRRMTDGLYVPAHQVHDELIYVVEERFAEPLVKLLIKLMSTPPLWMPTLPVAAEAHVGKSYGDLK